MTPDPTPDAPGLPFARTIPGLIGHWRQQAATCRADAERLGESGPAYMELLRDAAQYEQTAHQLQTIAALPSDWVAVPELGTLFGVLWRDDLTDDQVREMAASLHKWLKAWTEAHAPNSLAAPSAPAEGGVSAGDAVFAFSAMLTSLPHVIPLGAAAWATPGADLAAAFNEANGLSVSRDFPEGLKFPEIEGKLLDVVKRASEEIKTAPEPLAQDKP